MRRHIALTLAAISTLPCVAVPRPGRAQDVSRSAAGGGISVPGWQGKVDAQEEQRGRTLNDARLAPEGDALHVTTGPAVIYWNPANRATGDYTVKAGFK